MAEQPQAAPGGPGNAGHPELEELAALIDGQLPAAEAARVRAHLASCEECYAVFSETLHLQEELREEEDPAWDLVAFPSERRRKRQPWWMAAAAALLVVGVGLGLWWRQEAAPDLSVETLAAQVSGKNLLFDEGKGTTRGPGEKDAPPLTALAFQSGAAALKLQVALRSNGDAPRAAAQMCQVLGIHRQIKEDRSVGPITSSRLNGTDSAEIKFYSDLPARLDKRKASADLAREAAARSKSLREDLGEQLYFDFGAWVAAGSIAAGAEDASFFQRRAGGSLLERLRKDKDGDFPPEVDQALAKVAAARGKNELAAADFRDLGKSLERIDRHYSEETLPQPQDNGSPP